MMVVVCLSCVLSTLPLMFYNLVSFLGSSSSSLIKVIDEAGAYRWIAWCNHISPAVNPMIYAYFNKNLLTELKYLVKCKRR